MTERIEYLFDLGVTCLWLMPFYPTARKDDGYDITDFFGVDPRLGTLGDFVELVRTARASGIRVIIDFVMNHTSDGHPWFKSARRSKDDPYRDYYVWSATEPKSSPKDVVFPDQENSIWELDPKTNEWYLHHFYKHQPDLNITNPEVQEEISRTLGFWLELGVSGFRVDAVPFLFAKDAAPGDPGVFDPNQYLGDVRNFVTRRLGDAVLLGEVNLPYKDQLTFFGGPDGDGLNMQFDFIGMQNMYLSLARGDARPIAKALRQRPHLDVTSQWANFVRNHDELTLDKLSEDERQEVFDAFGPDPDMQLYGRGLRRRLPSMLGGDERRMRMAYSLMFSLPGTPVLFYGEEIGMAENLDIPGRLAVRTPMQWTGGDNGGFSKARSGGSPVPSLTASTARTASTPPTSATTTSPSGGSSATSSTRTGSSPRSAGRRPRSSSSPTRRSWPTYAGRNPVGRWSRCTTSARTAPSCRSSSRTCRLGPFLSTCSTGSRSTNSTPMAGSSSAWPTATDGCACGGRKTSRSSERICVEVVMATVLLRGDHACIPMRWSTLVSAVGWHTMG